MEDDGPTMTDVNHNGAYFIPMDGKYVRINKMDGIYFSINIILLRVIIATSSSTCIIISCLEKGQIVFQIYTRHCAMIQLR